MALRRGFKSEAERISKRVLNELGMNADQSIAPEAIAELLGVEIRSGDELVRPDRFLGLEDLQPGAFSACTFRLESGRVVIVFNPLSAKTRRASDITHELAHILLNHEMGRVERLGKATFLSCDPVQEEEAAWLAGCLLLPRPLLLSQVRKGVDMQHIASKCGVSEDLVSYRLNVTGVSRQIRRT